MAPRVDMVAVEAMEEAVEDLEVMTALVEASNVTPVEVTATCLETAHKVKNAITVVKLDI